MQIQQLVGEHLVQTGAVTKADTPFVKAAVELIQNNLELVQDSDAEFKKLAVYPLPDLLGSGKADKIKEDNLKDICEYVLDQYASGGLREVCAWRCANWMILFGQVCPVYCRPEKRKVHVSFAACMH